MKIKFLGTGPGIARVDKNQSATYLEIDGKKVLVDCGDGTAKILVKEGLSGDCLDAILISHYHPDHVSGIFMILQTLYLEGRTKKLKVYLPERIDDFIKILDMFYTFSVKFTYQLEFRLIIDVPQWITSLDIIPTDHLAGYAAIIRKRNLPNEMNSYSFIIREGRNKVVISSDINSIDSIEPSLEEADYLIIDALHPDLKNIIRCIPKVRKKVILTHGISDDLKEFLLINPQPKVIYAQENDEIVL